MNKIAVLMPTDKTVQVRTMASVFGILCAGMTFQNVDSSLVYDARNQLINAALQTDADYLLWIDSDVVFPKEALDCLIADNKDFVTGLYFGRKGNHEPVIYKNVKRRTMFRGASREVVTEINKPLIEVEACGFGFVLMKRKVAEEMAKAYKSPFEPFAGLGEDLSFCYRWRKLSKKNKIFCDTRFEMLHVGTKEYGKNDLAI